jgi:predicted ferric reductase
MQAIRPRRDLGTPLLVAAGAGAAAVLWLWWQNTASVGGNTGDWLVGAGRITGLLGGYGIALTVLMMSRVPALEQRVGTDRVSRWHAMLGRYAICLIVAHVVLVVFGYAAQGGTGVIDQTATVVLDYPEVLKAVFGTALLLVVGIVSAGAVRRRVRYETWYYLHLTTYLAVFLTFWHQLATGAEFAGNAVATIAWYLLYGAITGVLIWFRVLTPVLLNVWHRMHVENVVPEAPGVVSVLIGGKRLHRLGAQPGQFFRWRFLAKGMWWSANPYSLSASPRPNLMRITVKASGNHSRALADIKPGTRVWAEGPYGAMTAARRTQGKVLLLAGGAGITPMRALFDTLPGEPGDLTLLYRATTTEDLALWEELRQIAETRGARLLYAVNSPDGKRPEITANGLKRTLADIDDHDVYLCGPPAFSEGAYNALREAGVPSRRIHHESFEF